MIFWAQKHIEILEDAFETVGAPLGKQQLRVSYLFWM